MSSTEQEQTGVNGVTQLLRAIGSWGTPSGRGLHMFRSLMVASSTAVCRLWSNKDSPSILLKYSLYTNSLGISQLTRTGNIPKAILGVSLAATLGLLTGSGSAGFLVGSCVGFVGASIAYHRLSLAQALAALRENPRLLQLHLAYNFPLAGFGGHMSRAQLRAPYWRDSLHRQMFLIAAWQSASVQLDDLHEARTRAEVERIMRGESRGELEYEEVEDGEAHIEDKQ